MDNSSHAFEALQCPDSAASSTSSTSFDFHYRGPGPTSEGTSSDKQLTVFTDSIDVGIIAESNGAGRLSQRDVDGLSDALTRFYTPLGPRRKRGRGEYLALCQGLKSAEPVTPPVLMPQPAQLGTGPLDKILRKSQRISLRKKKSFSTKSEKRRVALKVKSPNQKRLFLVPPVIPKHLEDIFRRARETAATSIRTVDALYVGHLPPCIWLGRNRIQTLSRSFYPEEYAKCECLYVCEFCLSYMKTKELLISHYDRCPFHRPPGKEMYSDSAEIQLPHTQSRILHSLIVYEIDGAKNILYCQNLCRLSTLYLDTKVVVYDVEGFVFYVLCYRDELGDHIVGYFSKDKSFGVKCNNLSCFLVLPPYQRSGFGHFLVGFSYLLSKVNGMPGTPERPLSASGEKTYRSYWRSTLLKFLLAAERKQSMLSIQGIAEETGMWHQDVAGMLQEMKCLTYGYRSLKWELTLNPTTYLAFKKETELRSFEHLPVREENLVDKPFRQFWNLPGKSAV